MRKITLQMILGEILDLDIIQTYGEGHMKDAH